MTYLECEIPFIRADSVCLFNVGRVHVLNDPPTFASLASSALCTLSSPNIRAVHSSTSQLDVYFLTAARCVAEFEDREVSGESPIAQMCYDI